jgi:hypothetical protein
MIIDAWQTATDTVKEAAAEETAKETDDEDIND